MDRRGCHAAKRQKLLPTDLAALCQCWLLYMRAHIWTWILSTCTAFVCPFTISSFQEAPLRFKEGPEAHRKIFALTSTNRFIARWHRPTEYFSHAETGLRHTCQLTKAQQNRKQGCCCEPVGVVKDDIMCWQVRRCQSCRARLPLCHAWSVAEDDGCRQA